jgi:hypothetical protein
MTKDDIIRMAKEAGFERTKMHGALERFAYIVAATEREACAELIPPQYFELRDRIRARGQE